MVLFVVVCLCTGGFGIGRLVLGANMDSAVTRGSRNRAGGLSLEERERPGRENFSNFPLSCRPTRYGHCTSPTVPLSHSGWTDAQPWNPTSPLAQRPTASNSPSSPLCGPSPHLDKHPQTPPSTWLCLFCCGSPHHPHSSKPHLSLICQWLDGADNIPPIQTDSEQLSTGTDITTRTRRPLVLDPAFSVPFLPWSPSPSCLARPAAVPRGTHARTYTTTPRYTPKGPPLLRPAVPSLPIPAPPICSPGATLRCSRPTASASRAPLAPSFRPLAPCYCRQLDRCRPPGTSC